MTKAGEGYWRLHVEVEAGVHPKDWPEADPIRARLHSLWETLPEKDRGEVRERLRAASGE